MVWAARPLRVGEVDEMTGTSVERLYYRGVQESVKGRGFVRKARKAASHALGGLRLLTTAGRGQFDVLHFQWAVAPAYDAMIMGLARRRLPVILTVHDLEPFNGDPTSRLQTTGFDRALRGADAVIVHTEESRAKLIARGFAAGAVATIPHGPLTLSGAPVPDKTARAAGAPWRVVLFGKLQPYKGVDVLIEALGRLPPEARVRLRVIVAGEPLMPMEPLLARVAELGVEPSIEFRLRRHTEREMAELFAQADAFVFPYRAIEASGVLHLVAAYGRWLIASDLGAFRDAIDERNGARTPPGDADALAKALAASIDRVPDAASVDRAVGWKEIGLRTRAVYREAIARSDAKRRA